MRNAYDEGYVASYHHEEDLLFIIISLADGKMTKEMKWERIRRKISSIHFASLCHLSGKNKKEK
jgi:hypothetical protein